MTDEIIDFCTQKWQVGTEDPRIKYFIEKKDSFYDGFSDEMKKCIDSFLKTFDYYSHKSINKEYRNLHNQLLSTQDFEIDYTIFSILKSQDNAYNSSYGYTTEYKSINEISSDSIYPELKDCFEKDWWSDIQNIVFIDDFCGTGKTLCDYLDTIKLNIKDKHIFYIVVHVMQQGIMKIEEYAKHNNLQITLLCNHCAKPAFAENDNAKYEKPFIALSKEREIDDNHIMGYGGSQALVAFCENTPNNTLGLFRYETEKNDPIFPRKKERKPAFLMKEKRKQKKINNYVCARKSRGNE